MCRPKRVYRSIAATSSVSAIISHTPGGKSIQRFCGRKLCSKSFSHVLGAATIVSFARPFASPRSAPHIPSVTMNGVRSSRVMSSPMRAPHAEPAATPPSAATSGGTFCFKSSAIATVQSAMFEPMERSMPPEMMISVMPSAAVPTTAVCSSMI